MKIDEEWLNVDGAGQCVWIIEVEDKHGTNMFIVEDNELAADLMLRHVQIEAVDWTGHGQEVPTWDLPTDQGARDEEISRISSILNEKFSVYVRANRQTVGTLSPIARLNIEPRQRGDEDG